MNVFYNNMFSIAAVKTRTLGFQFWLQGAWKLSIFLTSKHWTDWKINRSSCICEAGGHTVNFCPQEWGETYKESGLTEQTQWKRPGESSPAAANLAGSWRMAGCSEWTSLSSTLQGDPANDVARVTFWAHRVYRENTAEKPSWFPSSRSGKEPFWNTPEHSILAKARLQVKLRTSSLTCGGFIRNKLTWEKKCSLSPF